MSLTEDPEPSAPAEDAEPYEHEHKEPAFWATFAAADIRNLIVTVAGTVIGGLVLLIAVATAIILARTARGQPASAVVKYVVLMFVAGFAGIGAFRWDRGYRREVGKHSLLFLWVGVTGVLAASFLLLVLAGIAYGVK